MHLMLGQSAIMPSAAQPLFFCSRLSVACSDDVTLEGHYGEAKHTEEEYCVMRLEKKVLPRKSS